MMYLLLLLNDEVLDRRVKCRFCLPDESPLPVYTGQRAAVCFIVLHISFGAITVICLYRVFHETRAKSPPTKSTHRGEEKVDVVVVCVKVSIKENDERSV